jgi:hypothetical protein
MSTIFNFQFSIHNEFSIFNFQRKSCIGSSWKLIIENVMKIVNCELKISPTETL